MDSASEALIVEFAGYNYWANLELLKACEGLSEAQLQTSAPGTFGTIRDTLAHLIRSEAYFLFLLTGREVPSPYGQKDSPSVADIRRYVETVGPILADVMIHTNLDDTVREKDNGQVYTYKAVVVLIQVINHGVEHRTNVTTILAQLGVETPGIDGWGYLRAHQDRLGIS
ncbi:MAG TPA: DinB family protein [Anaerolineae bacterium]